jgi:hypothetical protein
LAGLSTRGGAGRGGAGWERRPDRQLWYQPMYNHFHWKLRYSSKQSSENGSNLIL